MTVQRLTISHVRIIEHAQLEPSPSANLLTGANAAGKTSLLEAIDTLSRGRSFRTRLAERLIAHGHQQLVVTAELRSPGQPARTVGLERSRDGSRIRVDGRPAASIAEIAALLPVQVLHPESHQLIQGGPSYRRAYVDWGTFHVERRFLATWQRYHRALRQRNAALRASDDVKAVRAWHAELAQTAELIDAQRVSYLRALLPVIGDYVSLLPAVCRLQVEYQRGWPEGSHLGELLDQQAAVDQQRGHTRLGPHRADLEIRLDDRLASATASRGQQKLLAAALRLAQTRVFIQSAQRTCLFLIDDLPAELAPPTRLLLMQALAQLDVQVFMTAIDAEGVDLGAWRQPKRFHVERGHIREMV